MADFSVELKVIIKLKQLTSVWTNTCHLTGENCWIVQPAEQQCAAGDFCLWLESWNQETWSQQKVKICWIIDVQIITWELMKIKAPPLPRSVPPHPTSRVVITTYSAAPAHRELSGCVCVCVCCDGSLGISEAAVAPVKFSQLHFATICKAVATCVFTSVCFSDVCVSA